MQFSQALNPRRIARSLVTVLVLTLIETVVAPVIAPIVTAPKAEAVDVTYTGNTTGLNVVIPAGVYSVTLTARGAAGGTGGNDSGALGLASSKVGYVTGTFAVTPGDRLSIYPGATGGGGASSASSAAGGSGGAASLYLAGSLSPAFRFNGTISDAILLKGGTGGAAGSGGSSGGGGGGGAATLVVINDNVALLAGGGGGGGGGSGAGAQPWDETFTANSTSSPTGANGTGGGGCGNTDGGGSGAGGGGWYGGAGGVVDRPGNTGECRAFTGSPGGNFIASNATHPSANVLTAYTAAAGEGAATYVFNYSTTTTCTQDTQTYDIYTIVKVTTTTECNWSVPSTVNVIDLFLVGGGGGGAGDAGPGGGGGAVLSRTAIAVTPSSTMKLKVGYGGAGSGWGYVQTAYRGDSTTVITSTGTLYYALGGTASLTGTTASVTGNQTVQNGSFDGGIGGTATNTTNTVGGAGSAGVSNYFYGVQNTYSGGGGGGCYFNNTYGTSTSGSSGANGGGSGCSYDNSTAKNSNGSNGEANRGGGGGGGGAGNAFRTIGGKGGSGVILIRYATNSADEFPASLTSALSGHYAPGDLQVLDSGRKGWIDSSGTRASVAHANITGSPSIVSQGPTDTGNATGSTKTEYVASIPFGSKINILDLQTGYTLFHVARYIRGGTSDRIISATGTNWLSGFDNGELVTYHGDTYLGNYSGGKTYKWRLTTDQARVYRSDGIDMSSNDTSIGTGVTSVTGFGINQTASRNSDAQVSDIFIFNRELTNGEVRAMEVFISRIHGLTLDPLFNTSETDTAFDSSSYDLWAQRNSSNNINDTFTVEAWIKPSASCENTGVECAISDSDLQLRLALYEGKFRYMLGGDSSWAWISTGVAVKSGEWHHIALAKTLPGNQNDSIKFYLDGKLTYTKLGNPYKLATTAEPTPSDARSVTAVSVNRNIGCYVNGTARFQGLIDEYKIWRAPRSASQIAQDMYSNDTSSALMQAYYNFNAVPGTRLNDFKIQNLAYYGGSRSDLFSTAAYSSFTFTDIKTVVTSQDTYTTITFPRSYITQFGGWKVPTGISLVQAAVIGGGGGGGGGYEGGGGGAGGFIETVTTLTPGNIYPIKVGFGGRGVIETLTPTSGDTSTAFGFTAVGGGAGAYEFIASQGPATSGGSGGGGSWGNVLAGGAGISGQGNNGGDSSNLSGCSSPSYATYAGAGGGGAGGIGVAPGCTKGGNGGAGALSTVIGSYVAAGGGGSARATTITSAAQGIGGSSIGGNSAYTSKASVGASGGATNGKYGTGSGGGAGFSIDATSGNGGAGGSGIVALRYITALVPTYTKPSNVTLDVGQGETFTTNVAQDSATAFFTRTFKWESITPSSGGIYTTVKVGTGATNAAYGWVPSDTSTSGSGYLYRLTVTDSDTAGLFISDSSTAWATINPAMVITKTAASDSLVKKINLSRTETYTITLGTSTYRTSLSPVIKGITIETSTAGTVVLKIAETATVGTWLETLTVTDSVSASVVIPLSITVAAPPTLLNTGEIVSNGLKLNLDAGNSASFIDIDSATATNSYQWKDISGNGKNASTGSNYDGGYSCTSPQYSTQNGGHFVFSGSGQCFNTPNLGETFTAAFTVESWFKSGLATMNSSSALITQYQNLTSNVAYMLGDFGGGNKITVSSYGSNWNICSPTSTVVQGKWTHAVGTYDGSKLRIYIDGVLENTCNVSYLPASPTSYGTWIGRRWDSNTYFNGSIATARVYSRALSDTEVAQNFNATKFRFKDAPAAPLKPSKKYGTLILESFTATSGYDAKSIALAVGDRAGIDWDTATVPNQINLSVQESLTVGTYYDTITVTDSLGQSTYLPFTFTVSKADTLTVTMGTAVTTVYSGSVPTNAPKATITGLVGFDTATVSTLYAGSIGTGTSCATGGTCVVGDTGPGGGKVFYVSNTIINGVAGISDGGIYLEAAPSDWKSDDISQWASVLTDVKGTTSAIGSGAFNTKLIIDALGSSGTAAKLAADLTYGGKSDWFLASTAEMQALINNVVKPGTWAFLPVNRNYFTSTQNSSSTSQADNVWSTDAAASGVTKSGNYYMRPIRAFGGTTSPIDVDTYTVRGNNLTFNVGYETNYQAIVYETSTLKITQANQNKISINLYGAVAGESFTVTVSGGSGTGAITESVTAGGNATGCTVANHVLWNTNSKTDQKYCRILVTKAASRNYLSDSITADVYFMVYINNQPTNQVGSGSTIALNGITSFDTSTVTPPTITSISWAPAYTTICPGISGLCNLVAHYEIMGTGFGALANRNVVIKFWRNKAVASGNIQDGMYVNGDTQIILLALPAGVTPGRIAVITPNGEAVSDFIFTP